jgi:hypothetical protein
VPSYSTGFWVAKTRNGDGDVALLHALEQAGLRLRRRAVDLVDQHDVGEDRPGPELEAGLALVVDLRAHDVCRKQIGRALHARELAVDGTRERARERGLAHARIVLHEDVALGEQGHDHALEHFRPDLDGGADVGRHAAGHGDRRVDLRLAQTLRDGFLQRFHQRTLMSDCERRLKTASRIAAAIRAFDSLGTCSSS